ncbi:uncharacterized protein LOC132747739 [Ruditapes philippinarum]|uniref:uncharacterized protein LOC132747739 n=1 Tax=Ruditapes philippinarum TaxID=129788 RepID=UPI00295BD017|nr:uncharacterized protein LOC132747739 [Ruditapes philippinarum]
MASLRSRDSNSDSNTKIFLLSGLGDNVRRDLARKIHLLGGKYFDLQDFKAICTHVVCGRLSRSEKFLGACATGKWVLHPDYVQDSYIAGSWLDKEQYEWCDSHITNKYQVDMALAFAARRWRFMLGGASAAFTGWKVAVIAGAKRSKVIKGLLVSGGADVLQLRIPVRNPAKVADTLGYIFVSEHNAKSFIHLIDYGVLCIKPEFIGDFLIKDPQPDPMDYLVQVNRIEEPLSEESFLMSSQNLGTLTNQDSPIPQSPSSSNSMNTPCKERAITPSSSTEKFPSHTEMSKRSKSTSRPVSKLVDDITDLIVIEEQSSSLNKTKHVGDQSVGDHDNVEVIDLTDSSEDSDVNINAGITEKDSTKNSVLDDDLEVRKSKRNVVKKSPAWKSLMPRRRTMSKPDEIKEEPVENDQPKDNVLNKSKDNVVKTSTSAASSSTVKRNLLDSMVEQPIRTSTPAKTLTKSKTLSKTPSITQFFKQVSRQGSPVACKSLKLETSDVLSQPTCDKISSISCDKTVERKEGSDSKNVECSSDVVEPVNHSVSIGSKQVTQSGNKVTDMQVKGKELKENTKKVEFSKNKECKNKVVKASQQHNGTRENQSVRKQKPDGKGDRKRKSTDLETDGTPIIGPSEKKRITRSSPAKNKDISLVGSPDSSPSIHGLTTILLSPSKKKSVVTGQQSTSENPIATSGIQRTSSDHSENKDRKYENGRKRKSEDAELEYVLAHIKRKKMGFTDWCPPSLIVNLRETEDVPDLVMMPTTTTEIFMATLEDGFTFEALEYLESQVTFKYYPQSDSISQIMRNVLLKTEDETLRNRSYNILLHMLMVNPPVTASLQQVYLRALAGCKIEEDCQIGAEWDFIHQMYKKCDKLWLRN